MSRSRSLYLEHSDNSEHPTSNEMCCEALGIKCAVVLCWKTISTFCNNHKGGEVFSTWRNLASDTIFSGNNENGAKGAFTIPDIEIKSWTIDRCRCKYLQSRNIYMKMCRPRRSVSGQFSVGVILNVLNGITLFLSRPLFVVFKQTSEMSYSPTVQLLTSKTRRT